MEENSVEFELDQGLDIALGITLRPQLRLNLPMYASLIDTKYTTRGDSGFPLPLNYRGTELMSNLQFTLYRRYVSWQMMAL